MALFNFKSGKSISDHPFCDSNFYNDTILKLSKIMGIEISLPSGCDEPSGKMPIFMARKQIIESNVLCIEMNSPMMAAFNHIPVDSLSINPRFIYHIYKARQSVKLFIKHGISRDDMTQIQYNMKVFVNMAYGRVDARNSIIRSCAGFDGRKLITDFFQKMIDIIVHDVPVSELLYYDGDTIYVKFNDKTRSKIADALYFIEQHYEIKCDVNRHDHLIIPVKKKVITFNGSITGLCISGYDELIEL